MVTVLCEKKSVAVKIAAALGEGQYTDEPGWLSTGPYWVTWASGHLVEAYVKEDDEANWRQQVPPLIPDSFSMRVVQRTGDDGKRTLDQNAVKMLATIKKLFDRSDFVINFCAPSREGELIFRYIFDYLGCRKPFYRAWVTSLTDEEIRAGIRRLRPGYEYNNLYNAARARDEADWMVGVNATRAMTLSADVGRTLSLGRVQTSALAIAARSFIAREEYEPERTYTVRAVCESRGEQFFLETEPYPTREKAEEACATLAKARTVHVTKADYRTYRTAPPLLYDLTELQMDANRIHGFTAKYTSDLAQSLYMDSCITFPRTAGKHITEEQAENIGPVLEYVNSLGLDSTGRLRLDPVHFNRNCVAPAGTEENPGITVTGVVPENISKDERKTYDLIALRMAEAFSPDTESDGCRIDAEGGGIPLSMKGRLISNPGWKRLRKAPFKKGQYIPGINEGDIFGGFKVAVCEKTEKTPEPLTEAGLLEAMAHAGKNVEGSRRWAECRTGIGTPSTRATIIEGLVQREYLERRDGKIGITPVGMAVYIAVSETALVDPLLTGKWEFALNCIAKGDPRVTVETFDEKIKAFTRQITSQILEGDHTRNMRYALKALQVTCPSCGKQVKLTDYGANCKCGLKILRRRKGVKLTDGQLMSLLEGGETEVIEGFKDPKTGVKYNAVLIRESATGKIKEIRK